MIFVLMTSYEKFMIDYKVGIWHTHSKKRMYDYRISVGTHA